MSLFDYYQISFNFIGGYLKTLDDCRTIIVILHNFKMLISFFGHFSFSVIAFILRFHNLYCFNYTIHFVFINYLQSVALESIVHFIIEYYFSANFVDYLHIFLNSESVDIDNLFFCLFLLGLIFCACFS